MGCVCVGSRKIAEDQASVACGVGLQRRLSFLFDERQAARRLSGFGVATVHQVQPIALWLLGPSAVGKTTQAKAWAAEFGIATTNGAPDAVIVDGEFFRDVHGSYQAWTKTEDWRAAYPALKSRIILEKKQMLHDAKEQKMHLIIPQTCLDLDSCLHMVQQLTVTGYTNNVIAIQAPKEEVERRGMLRAQSDGKVYDSSNFRRSMDALAPMIDACNGRFIYLYTSERFGGPNVGFDVRVKSEGWCGKVRVTVTQGI